MRASLEGKKNAQNVEKSRVLLIKAPFSCQNQLKMHDLTRKLACKQVRYG
jgi:hypothetical protein